MLVLWIDEDERFLARVRACFAGGADEVVTARRATDAMAVLQRREVDAVFCAHRVGPYRGSTLLRIVKLRRPRAARILAVDPDADRGPLDLPEGSLAVSREGAAMHGGLLLRWLVPPTPPTLLGGGGHGLLAPVP